MRGIFCDDREVFYLSHGKLHNHWLRGRHLLYARPGWSNTFFRCISCTYSTGRPGTNRFSRNLRMSFWKTETLETLTFAAPDRGVSQAPAPCTVSFVRCGEDKWQNVSSVLRKE